MPIQIPLSETQVLNGTASNSVRHAGSSAEGQRSSKKQQGKHTKQDLLGFIVDCGRALRLAAEGSGKGLETAIAQASITLREQFSASYQDKKFPLLNELSLREDASGESPRSLAEMFLWKQGDWLKYKNFCKQYIGSGTSTGNDVVIYAFARHLKDPHGSPIFDQHALRAVWALGLLSSSEEADAKAWLTKTGRKSKALEWKANGGGANGLRCYEHYKRATNSLLENVAGMRRGAVMNELDKLLMPLGQRIKMHADLRDLCRKG